MVKKRNNSFAMNKRVAKSHKQSGNRFLTLYRKHYIQAYGKPKGLNNKNLMKTKKGKRLLNLYHKRQHEIINLIKKKYNL